MYRNLFIIVFGLAVLLAVFLVNFAPDEAGRADYVWSNGTEPQTLDTGIMSGQPEGEIAWCLFEGLTTYHPETLAAVPGVAESWSLDGRTYTFRLRPDCWWVRGEEILVGADGRPRNVTADDFVFAWQRHFYSEVGSEYSFLISSYVEGAAKYEELVSAQYEEVVAKAKEKFGDTIDMSDPVSMPEELRDELSEYRGRMWVEHVGVKSPDPLTLQITLKSPVPYFTAITSFYAFCPVPRDLVEEHGKDWILPENLATNGPFTLDVWTFNSSIRMKKNRHYWETARYAADTIAMIEGMPEDRRPDWRGRQLQLLKDYGSFVERGFDTIEGLAIEQQNTFFNMYVNGDVDRIRECPVEVVGDLIAQAQAKPDSRLAEHVHHDFTDQSYFYQVNTTLDVFKRKEEGRKLRRALALAVDRQTLIDIVTRANQKPAYRLATPLYEGYSRLPLFGSGDYATDLAEAKRLVQEVRDANVTIPKLTILYNTHQGHAAIAAFIQNRWKNDLGIDVGLQNQEWQVFLDSRRTANYDVARAGWIGDYPDPNTYLDMYTTPNQNNDPKYSDPVYDRIILDWGADILSALATPEKRQEILDFLKTYHGYDKTIAVAKREDGRTLETTLEEALAGYDDVPEAKRLEEAFRIRLLLLEAAEQMLIWDMPVIPLYFYTNTQLWPPQLQGFFINARDSHPLKFARWKDGKRPTGARYEAFPRLPTQYKVGQDEGKAEG